MQTIDRRARAPAAAPALRCPDVLSAEDDRVTMVYQREPRRPLHPPPSMKPLVITVVLMGIMTFAIGFQLVKHGKS